MKISKKDKDRTYFRRDEAASYLSISVRSVDQLKHDGDLPFCKIGATIVFTKEDLDGFMLSNRIAVND